jgi:uncharacterized SAM-binding protein YcdF (DUF218 family)
MFLLKKILSGFLNPAGSVAGLLLIGLFLLVFTKRQRAGKWFVALGTLLFLLMSSQVVVNPLSRPLERAYPPLLLPADGSQPPLAQPIKYIVVLGGGHVVNPALPVAGQLQESTTVRLAEGIALWRRFPGSRLVVSGGPVFGTASESKLMAEMAEELGVNQEAIVQENRSLDTGQEARLLRPLLGTDPFLLVTSADHIPRSMVLFHKNGMNPIPAPSLYFTNGIDWRDPQTYFPNPWVFDWAGKAVHEYYGLAWAYLIYHP